MPSREERRRSDPCQGGIDTKTVATTAHDGSIRTRRWLDKEQPRGDDTAGETRHGSGDQPVQAATGLDQEGEPGNANEHGGDRVRGEPFDVAGPS